MYILNILNGEKNTETHLFYKKSPVGDLLFLEISPSPKNLDQTQKLTIMADHIIKHRKFSLVLDLSKEDLTLVIK